MKIKNSLKKILISLILAIALTNFVMPNHSQAISGGDLAEPIFQFVTWLGDCVIEFLQKNIGNGEDFRTVGGDFRITYTLGNIFANKIAMLDVNFVEPNEYERILEGGWKRLEYDGNVKWSSDYLTPEGSAIKGLTAEAPSDWYYKSNTYETTSRNLEDIDNWGPDDIHTVYIWEWQNEGKDYLCRIEYDHVPPSVDYARLYVKTDVTSEEVPSIAFKLQSIIAKWYKGIRNLSLVGLLSVLIYIGIRIIISSSSEDKAKYKKMIMNWIAAICIVFILHYIMVFILTLSESLIDIFSSDISGKLGEDKAMMMIRKDMGDSGPSVINNMAKTVCYAVLVIYTCIFTVQYLKRVVYMAFLTMIAPLIALTYPLDKLKDGKAQAFSMWLKEYIFNALLQPIHLLLYNIFVFSIGTNFITSNPIYAIVAIGFLVPAEKFFRKMFGMESQTSVGTLGAAAGGAMVMNMLNKLRGKPPKEEGEQQQKVRTANQNGGGSGGANQTGTGSTRTGSTGTGSSGTGSSGTGSTGTGSTGTGSTGTGSTGTGSTGTGSTGTGSTGTGSTGTGSTGTSSTRTSSIGTSSTGTGSTGTGSTGTSSTRTSSIGTSSTGTGSTGTSSTGSRMTPVSGQRYTRTLGNWINQNSGKINAVKKYGREGRRLIVGAAGGLAGATIGIAAGVATGDLGNVFQYGITGATAGAYSANNLTDNAFALGGKLKRGVQKKAMGIEAYNNAQYDKQVFQSDEYKMLEEKFGKKTARREVQAFLNQGFTDTEQMGKLLEKGVTAETYGQYASVGLKDADTIKKLQTAGVNNTPISPETYKAFTDAGLRDVDKMSDLAKDSIDAKTYSELASAGITNINTIKKHKAKTAEQLKQMKRIAKYSQKALENVNNEDKVDVDGVGVPGAFYKLAEGFDAEPATIKDLWENLEDFM